LSKATKQNSSWRTRKNNIEWCGSFHRIGVGWHMYHRASQG
jgi:hypothetical protein